MAAACAFCGIVTGDADADAEVVLEERDVVAFLDRRPVFKGHLLVVPRAHVDTLADLPAALIAPLFAAVQRCAAAMPAALGAQGSWVSINNVVSQSVPHLHVHVVPAHQGRRAARLLLAPHEVRRRGRDGRTTRARLRARLDDVVM